jgi:hypothetical protein
VTYDAGTTYRRQATQTGSAFSDSKRVLAAASSALGAVVHLQVSFVMVWNGARTRRVTTCAYADTLSRSQQYYYFDRLFLRTCKNCGCHWCWICREKVASHTRCPKPLREVAQTNPRERFKLTSAAVAKLETAEYGHTFTEAFIMHRVRARLLQTYFTSIASEMYIPDLIALPPISLRRRVFANLVQALPNVATVFQDAQALLELVPFASLADALQLPSQEAAKRLKAIHQHLLREVQSVPSSQLDLGSISTQTLVDLVTEYFPFHSKAARSLLSFKGTGEFDGCSITQVLALNLREEWPLFLQAAGIDGECLDRIIQVTWWFFPLAFQRITACVTNR